VSPGPTKVCGSTLLQTAEGIREPWMLACSISAIQVIMSINWYWDAYTGGALVDELFVLAAYFVGGVTVVSSPHRNQTE
jgi:hypothetical protein